MRGSKELRVLGCVVASTHSAIYLVLFSTQPWTAKNRHKTVTQHDTHLDLHQLDLKERLHLWSSKTAREAVQPA